MISESQINELKNTWQTTELNVAREYVQNVLLEALYKNPNVKLAFKGGTALRFLRRSPRFSEDLDFTGWGKPYHFGEWIKQSVAEAGKTGLKFEIIESNATTGGWFALVKTAIHHWPIEIEWNISARERKIPKTETVLISSPLWTAYSINALAQEDLVREKVSAALSRKQPRDFYDLYFILRDRFSVQVLVPQKTEIMNAVRGLTPSLLYGELKFFLPRSHWNIIKQLPHLLKQELERL